MQSVSVIWNTINVSISKGYKKIWIKWSYLKPAQFQKTFHSLLPFKCECNIIVEEKVIKMAEHLNEIYISVLELVNSGGKVRYILHHSVIDC